MAVSPAALPGPTPPRETSRARDAFNRYLAMGPERSLRGLAATMQQTVNAGAKPPTLYTLMKWSARYGWDTRAHDHDAEVSRRAAERLAEMEAKAIVARRKQRLEVAAIAMDSVAEALTTPQGKRRPLTAAGARARGEPRDYVTPSELRSITPFWSAAMEAERLDSGEATARQDVRGGETTISLSQQQGQIQGQGQLDARDVEQAAELGDFVAGALAFLRSVKDQDGQGPGNDALADTAH